MKNLYSLDKEEKNRILTLHEGTTKKQYLTETPESDYLAKLPKETQDKFYKLGVSWKAAGTNPNNLIAALKTFTADDFKLYNNYLATIKPEGHTSFQGIINGEMEYGNLQDVINITNELKRLGVNATYKTVTKDKYGVALATPGFETNSFKTGVVAAPVVAKTGVELDATWTTTYKCVTSQPGAKAVKLKDGSTAYQIGKITYYNNGRKFVDGKPYPYSCNEFKGNVVDKKADIQQRRQQVIQKTQNTTKEIQKLLGQEQTGNLDLINVEKMIDLLNQ